MAVGKPENFRTQFEEGRAFGATLASAATIAPTHQAHLVTGTVQVATITPPGDGFEGPLFLVFTNASPGALLTSGNIANAVTPVTNVPVLLVYNKETAKWYAGECT